MTKNQILARLLYVDGDAEVYAPAVITQQVFLDMNPDFEAEEVAKYWDKIVKSATVTSDDMWNACTEAIRDEANLFPCSPWYGETGTLS